jgi:hypothetical protein
MVHEFEQWIGSDGIKYADETPFVVKGVPLTPMIPDETLFRYSRRGDSFFSCQSGFHQSADFVERMIALVIAVVWDGPILSLQTLIRCHSCN